MDNQRLRNLTTRRLHTVMAHIYEDIEFLTGFEGIMTHNSPNALTAMEPWLLEKLEDIRFWDGEFDITHTGTTDIRPMNEDEKTLFWVRFNELASPFERAK